MIEIIAILFLGFCVLVLFRSHWVFSRRNELNRFENGVHVIMEYISYDAMMLRFWIWDIEKLRKL